MMYDIITVNLRQPVMSVGVKFNSMSKSKTPDAQPVKKVSTTSEALKKLGKAAATRVSKMAASPKFWLLLCIGIAGCFSREILHRAYHLVSFT